MSKINELIKLIQEAVYSAKQPGMDGAGIWRAVDALRKIETQKLCVKAHEEEKYLRSLVMMHTGYSDEELEMILEDDSNISDITGKAVDEFYEKETKAALRKMNKKTEGK